MIASGDANVVVKACEDGIQRTADTPEDAEKLVVCGRVSEGCESSQGSNAGGLPALLARVLWFWGLHGMQSRAYIYSRMPVSVYLSVHLSI